MGNLPCVQTLGFVLPLPMPRLNKYSGETEGLIIITSFVELVPFRVSCLRVECIEGDRFECDLMLGVVKNVTLNRRSNLMFSGMHVWRVYHHRG